MVTVVIWIVVFIGIFYFLAIRPQRRQRQEHHEMTDALRPGDEVITIGGLYGTVTGIGGDWIELAIASRTRVRLMKRAVSSVTANSDDQCEGADSAEAGGETGDAGSDSRPST